MTRALTPGSAAWHADRRTCQEWTGSIASNGYGRLGRRWAHRIAYAGVYGPIPKGMHIDHLCRNRACVNPEHLEAVTQAENNRRTRLVDCRQGHPLVEANVYEWGGRRYCRQCRIDWGRKARAA